MTFLALLRGINVGGHNKIPMAELRSLCSRLGWKDVRSYIQSGNVLFQAQDTAADLERALEGAIQGHFGLAVPVLVRTSAEWSLHVAGNPFPEFSVAEPNLVMLALSKARPNPDAVERLRERAADGERIAQVGSALWIHFAAGGGKSKLSPALLDRLVGSPVTLRNWRTVINLHDMMRSVGQSAPGSRPTSEPGTEHAE